MRLSRTVGYAVQATLQLAQTPSGRPVPCSRLAAVGKMPERFLLQVLRNLVTHGILRSTRGVDGGYSLDRNAEEISLLEVMEAIEGPHGSGIPEGDGFSEQAQQTLRAALAQVADTTRSQLAAIKLSSLIPSPAAQGDKAEATA